MSPEELAPLVGPAIQRYLAGDLGPPVVGFARVGFGRADARPRSPGRAPGPRPAGPRGAPGAGLRGRCRQAGRHPGGPRARAGEPDRRAHRLQRGLRAPGRDRPRDLDRPDPDRRRARPADAGRDRGDRRARRRGSWSQGRHVAGLRQGHRLGDARSRVRAARVRRGARVGPAAGRGPLVVRRAPGGVGVGALRGRAADGRPDGPRPHRPAVGERVHRPQQRDHGPVRVDLRNRGPCPAARLPEPRASRDPARRPVTRARRLPLGLAAEAGVVGVQRAALAVRGGGRGDRPDASPA